MKYATAALVAVLLVFSFAGCGGGTKGDATDSLSLLVDSTQAMTEVSGYRMSGTITMDSGTGGQSQPISMDIRAEVQNIEGGMRQHMFVTIGDYEVEAYIVEGVYYQNLPGQGWMKMSTAAYMSQNMNLGLVDAAQMEMMAQLALDAEVVEEDEETTVISFHLDQEYLQASLELYRKYIEEGDEQLPEEWLQMAEESITDFKADIRISLNNADNLIKRMEMTYTMAGLPEVGEVSSSMKTDFYDYGADIEIELPPEAAQAPEVDLGQ
jgi:phage terminase small subunit